jgi:4'-phosphopantetheinyl transferase
MPCLQPTVSVRFRVLSAASASAFEANLGLLSSAERWRAERFVHERDRRAYVAAHALLRRSLSMHAHVAPGDWMFTEGPYGKPSIASEHELAQPLSFSLTHTDGCVACAVALGAEVGLDVECLDSAIDELDIARQYFGKAEIADLRRRIDGDRRERFAELWTLKEAYLKAIGVGLSGSLSAIEFGIDDRRHVTCDQRIAERWHFQLFAPTPRHRLAVAVSTQSAIRPRVDIAADPHDRRVRDEGLVPSQ